MKLILSRYACVRRDDERMIAEGLDRSAAVELDTPEALALLQCFVRPTTVEQACLTTELPVERATALAEALRHAGVLVDATTDETGVWTYEDRRFHTATRGAWLGPFPAPGAPAPPVAVPGVRWPETIELPTPDLDALERDDPPFAAVQAARRSVREPAPRPLTIAELGELLHRVARADDAWRAGGMEFVTRPYPSAGGLYELEIYVAVAACDGVRPGLHHYVSERHLLARAGEADELLAYARTGLGILHTPPALLVIAARFPRIAWKYGPLAYSLVLKDVGVVMQTVYLAATAMGLGACAVGTGDQAAFARATGLDPEEETSVGEITLSTMNASTE